MYSSLFLFILNLIFYYQIATNSKKRKIEFDSNSLELDSKNLSLDSKLSGIYM